MAENLLVEHSLRSSTKPKLCSKQRSKETKPRAIALWYTLIIKPYSRRDLVSTSVEIFWCLLVLEMARRHFRGWLGLTAKEPQLVEKSQNDLLGEMGTGIDGEGSHLRLDFSWSGSSCLKVKLKFPKNNPVRRFRNLPPPICPPSCHSLSPPWLDLSEPTSFRLNHGKLPSCYVKHQHLYGAQSRLCSDEEAEEFWGRHAPSSMYKASHLIYLI